MDIRITTAYGSCSLAGGRCLLLTTQQRGTRLPARVEWPDREKCRRVSARSHVSATPSSLQEVLSNYPGSHGLQ